MANVKLTYLINKVIEYYDFLNSPDENNTIKYDSTGMYLVIDGEETEHKIFQESDIRKFFRENGKLYKPYPGKTSDYNYSVLEADRESIAKNFNREWYDINIPSFIGTILICYYFNNGPISLCDFWKIYRGTYTEEVPPEEVKNLRRLYDEKVENPNDYCLHAGEKLEFKNDNDSIFIENKILRFRDDKLYKRLPFNQFTSECLFLRLEKIWGSINRDIISSVLFHEQGSKSVYYNYYYDTVYKVDMVINGVPICNFSKGEAVSCRIIKQKLRGGETDNQEMLRILEADKLIEIVTDYRHTKYDLVLWGRKDIEKIINITESDFEGNIRITVHGE